MKIANQTVLITGASSGIGEACAYHFAQAGARLLLCARRIDLIQQLAEQLKNQFNVEVHGFFLDVCQLEQVKSAMDALPREWKKIDILVNNAGLALGLDKIQDGNPADWAVMIDTNVKGLLYVTQAVLPQMLLQSSGHIINIGSISGHQVYPKGAVYCATKHAVLALSQGLRMDLLGTSIRVTEIDPGTVETNFSKVRFKGDSARAEQVYHEIDALRSDDIADAVLYCATRPAHVNIDEMIIKPTAQASVSLISKKPST